MTDAADLLLVDAEVHALTDPDETHEAVAIRDGEIVRVGSSYEVGFLEGVETDVVDCEGRVVLPGFVDAHTHVESLGQYLVHADLSTAAGPADCVDRLADEAARTDDEWILGFGYDESAWDDGRYLTRDDLDRVSEDRPVVAMRVDMHAASLNGVALDHLRGTMLRADVRTTGGEPTGLVVEAAAEAVWDAIRPDRAETRELVVAALEYAAARGVTCVHDKVRNSHAPRVYRDLAAEDDLDCRVRIDYWSDHLESVREVGLATDRGGDGELVQVGAIKSYSDGSIGARTAKLFEPYADASTAVEEPGESDAGAGAGEGESEDGSDDGRGQWVVDPGELRDVADEAADADLQLSVHAIGDEAIERVLTVLEDAAPADARHRIEHVELATDDHLERMADAGVVASMQPNFLRWAEAGGLYDRRLGEDRRRRANRFRTVLETGVPLAFGSDCMPLGPLLGVHHAVNAPREAQSLSVTEALRAYTRGGAYAGFDEDRLGTIEVGKRADLVVLEASPWDRPGGIDGIDVATTLVDGEVVYDGR